jgi:hypothetical protein
LGNFGEFWGILGKSSALLGNFMELWGILGNFGEFWGKFLAIVTERFIDPLLYI